MDIFANEGISAPKDIFAEEGIEPPAPAGLTMDETVQKHIQEVAAAANDTGRSLYGEGEWDAKVSKGKIGFWEAATEFTDLVDLAPVVGTQYRATQSYDATKIVSKLDAGEVPTDEEADKLRDVIGRRAEADARGFSVPGGIGYGLARMPAYMVEFALSKRGGKALATATGAEGKAKKATEIAGTIGGMAAIRGPESFRERRLHEYASITDKGELFIKEGQESPFLTALKAVGDTGVETVSEMSGGVIGKYAVGPVASVVKKPSQAAFNKLPTGVKDGLFKAYRAIKPNAKVTDLMTKAGFHGALNEMGEERVADVMRAALNLNDEGYSVDAILNQIVPSADQLMVEAGMFSIAGGTSTAASGLMNHLQKKGMSRAEAQETIDNLSATERDNLFESMSKEQIGVSLGNVKEKALAMATTAGVEEEEAEAWSETIRANALWGAKQYNISPEKYFENMQLELQQGETAPDGETLNKPIVVYHGTPSDFEQFDMDVADKNKVSGRYHGDGVYLTQNIGEAGSYSLYDPGTNESGNVIKAEINLKNPYGKPEVFSRPLTDQDVEKLSSIPNIKEAVQQEKDGLAEIGEPSDLDFGHLRSIAAKAWRLGGQKDGPSIYTQILKSLGFDGIDVGEGEFVVFDPKDIKIVGKQPSEKVSRLGDAAFQSRKIITLFQTADRSTLFHETGHLFLSQLKAAAAISEVAAKQLASVNKWLESEDGNYTREQEEKFARGFEGYLMEGSAPSQSLRETFESMKEWFREIYKSIEQLAAPLNNETREVIDQLFGGKDLDIYSPIVRIDNEESGWAHFYRDWVDSLSPIEQITKAFEKIKSKLPDGTSPILMARLYASIKGRIFENIQNQTFYVGKDGNSVVTGEGMKPILDDFDAEFKENEPDYKKRMQDFKDYLFARRLQQDLLDREDVEVSAKHKEEAETIMATLGFKYGSNFLRFGDYAQRIYDFEARILYNLVHAGIMSEKDYKKIIADNPNYVPFQRVFDEAEINDGFVLTSKGKFEGQSSLSIVQKIEGSDRDVQDVFQSIIRNTARILQASARNHVAASIASLANALPENIKKVKTPMKKISVEDGDGETIDTFRPAGKPHGNVIEYYVKGKRKYIEVSQPLYEAMQDMHPSQITLLGQILRGVASVFRAGATLVPEFWLIKNPVRDINAAFVQTKKSIKPVDIIMGLAAVMGKTELWHEWRRDGGSFDSYMNLTDDGMEKSMEELLRPQGRMMRYAKSLGLEALKDAAGATEAMSRIAVYRRAKLSGLSGAMSAFESRDGTLDFSRAGRKGRIANRYIPFLNAGIQGTSKLLRAFKEHPEVMTFRAAVTITAPSIIITGYYLYGAPDDERQEYLEIPQWQKDLFWCFKSGGEWRRVAKPFSLGYLFATLPERFMLWGYQGDKPEMEGLWRSYLLGLGGSLSPIQDVASLLTPVGRIAIESISNYNFFTGRPVYPAWMERLPPEERATKGTSEAGKLIGEAAGVSPAMVDNAVHGILASASYYALDAGDKIIKATREWNGEDVPDDPVTASDKMFVRGFSVRNPSGYQAISTQNFYDKWEKVEQAHTAFARKDGDEKQKYREENEQLIRSYKPMKKFTEQISDVGDRIDKIYEDPDMDSKEKVERIREYEDHILAIAKRGNEWFNEAASD